jgi:hypothetical protein
MPMMVAGHDIELTPLEEECFDLYTEVRANGRVWFKVNHQYFELAVEPEDAEHARWFRAMLAMAVARLLKEQRGEAA